MTQTGELTVTKIRVAHRLAEIEAITNLWEEWSRDLFINRFIFHEAQQGKQDVPPAGRVPQPYRALSGTAGRSGSASSAAPCMRTPPAWR